MFGFYNFSNLDPQDYSNELEDFRSLIDICNITNHAFNITMINEGFDNSMGLHFMCYGLGHIQGTISICNATCNDFNVFLFTMYDDFPLHIIHRVTFIATFCPTNIVICNIFSGIFLFLI